MSDAALLAIAVDRNAAQPLFQQVYEEIRQRILAGHLQPKAQLPPTRQFAQELGLSRSTITAAYEQLICEGYAAGQRGSGIYVTELPEDSLQTAIAAPRRTAPVVRHGAGQPRPFAAGIPDMSLFPYEKWAQAVARTARATPRHLILSNDAFGDGELRSAVCDHLSEWRGFAATPEQIVITAGAAGAIDMVFRSLAKPGNCVALEDPGYAPVRSVVSSLGLTPVWMRADEGGGANPEVLRTGGCFPHLICLTPSHQFPCGGAMPLARRLDFLDVARQTGSYIIEDDFDSEFRYSGRPIPAMAGLDEAGRVLYVGSFSKVFSAHIRLGYLVVPEPLVPRFRQTAERFGVGASIMPQRPLADFLRSGEFHRHIRRMRRIYADRREQFFNLVDRHLGPYVRYTDHQAGMTVLLRFKENWDDTLVARRAEECGLELEPASGFYAEQPAPPGLLAGFTACDVTELEAAVRMLSTVFADMCRKGVSARN
ncbi:MAG: PLP-dependent aminotransferase family protein [Pseudomonadota bacterium]